MNGKIQPIVALNFISSKDSEETRIMHSKCDNIEIMICKETDKIIEELFESFLQRYQARLEEKMRESHFFMIVLNKFKSRWIIYRFP